MHCTVLGSNVTSKRAETTYRATQLGLGEAMFPGGEDFMKMAKCRKRDRPVMKLNCDQTLSTI